MKRVVLACAVLLAACGGHDTSNIKAIIGAKLVNSAGREGFEHSVVVIENGKFREVGPMDSTPVPKDAQRIEGRGMTITPIDETMPIERGRSADLVLKGTGTKNGDARTMRAGEWIQ